MSNYDPLQAGDRLQVREPVRVEHTGADRRSQEVDTVQSEEGTNRAPSHGNHDGPMYKIGYIKMSPILEPPYNPVLCEGDTSGEGTQIYELDIDSYGDSYDPTAPMRVRQADQWTMDTDHDGKLN